MTTTPANPEFFEFAVSSAQIARKAIKEELLLNPDYLRISKLDYAPEQIEIYVSLFAAFKTAFGVESTVAQWEQYNMDFRKREMYENLREIICNSKIAKAGK